MATEVIIPALGVISEKVKILTWFKSEGDPVMKGEPLLEIESDKVTTEIPAPGSGILGRILYPEGSEVGITKVAAIIVAEGETVPEAFVEGTGEGSAPESVAPAVAEKARVLEAIKAVPTARKLAEGKGVDLSKVTPTGPHGTIMKKDVEDYLTASASSMEGKKEPKATGVARKMAEEFKVPLEAIQGTGVSGRIMKADVAAAAESKGEVSEGQGLFGKSIPMKTMRKVIAKRLSESAFTAPHIYLFTEVRVDKLLDLRESIVEEFEKRFKVRISINDFLIKAVALAIREYPLFNASLKGDEIQIHPDINVGLAVALEDGLIVPAIPQADRLGLGALAQQRVELVERAKKGKLTLAELERGTFTISSLASFDIQFFTAIINPPQSGILSVGKMDEQLYLENGQVKTRKVCRLGLSADHRIIDGAIAAGFLGTIKKMIENPMFYFLSL